MFKNKIRIILFHIIFAVIFIGINNLSASYFWWNDVPMYDQDWFNGQCSGDCTPTALGMVLAWHDSNGWPSMVHNGSNSFEKNPSGVIELIENLSIASDYSCNYGSSKKGTDLSIAVKNVINKMDSKSDFQVNYIDGILYNSLKNFISSTGPLMLRSNGIIYYYPDSSKTVLKNNHDMAMIGFDDENEYFGIKTRWMKVNMGWGDYSSPSWIDYDDNSSGNFSVFAITPGGTPSDDDDDKYEDNDYFEHAQLLQNNVNQYFICNDIDFFKIYLYKGSIKINFLINKTNPVLNLSFYSENKEVLEKNTLLENINYIEYTISQSGYYYLSTSNESNNVTSSNHCSLSIINEDNFEENNTSEKAFIISQGKYSNLICNDNDWYKLNLDDSLGSDDKLLLFLEFDSNYGELLAELYESNSNGSLITLNKSASNSGIVHQIDSDKEYYIKISGNNYAKNYYNLYYSLSKEVIINKGWNLLSIPCNYNTQDLNELLSDANYAYSFKNGKYIKVENNKLKPDNFYWIFFSKDKKIALNVNSTISKHGYYLENGWNLIGASLKHAIPVTDPEDCIINTYEYKNGKYAEVSILSPLKAYWVESSKKCSMNFHEF